MKAVFWISLAGTFYTYIGYPVLIWMLSKLRPRRVRVAPITPSVSIVMAVHNGAALIHKQIDHLVGLDYSNIREIIIVSDGSSDGTVELLREEHHPLVHSIILEEHSGKAVAVNAGVANATGEIILFVDIRPQIGQGAIKQMMSNFADPTVGCVAGELSLRRDGHDGATAAIGGLYWRYEQWIRTCESTYYSPVGVYGGFYAVRRELAAQQPAGLILDDMFQPLSIIRQGYRSVLDRDACVYDCWPKQVGGEFHRKVRTLAGNFQLFQLAPWTLTPRNRVLFQFLSHKGMRLVTPYLLMLMLISSAALAITSPLFAAFAAIQLIGWILAILGLCIKVPVLNRVATAMGGLLVLNAAAVVGMYRFLVTRGPLWKIWHSGQLVSREVNS